MDSMTAMGNILVPILGVLIALTAIGLIVTRLYRRASKETSFVRTGFRGQHVVVNGGCMVFPVLHETIPVNMNTLRLEVVRTQHQALITRDRMRVDVQAEFYVRVQPTEESIAAAAQTLGQRTMEPSQLKELVEGKFVDGLRSAAAKMGMEDLHEKRSEFVLAVQEAVQEDLLKNGLELESVSLTGFNQTSKEYFDTDNAFDAAGLTMLTEQIEDRRRRRNEIERDTSVEIARKDLETERAQLEIRRESEYLRLEQEREIETRRAEQNAQVSSERAEGERAAAQATINAERDTEASRIASEKALEEARIEQAMAIRLAEQSREIAVAERSQQESAAKANADAARAEAVRAEEAVVTAREQAKAERKKLIELVEARQVAERDAIQIKVAAETQRAAAEDEAEAIRTRAEANAVEETIRARAQSEAAQLIAQGEAVRLETEANGIRAINEAENMLSDRIAKLRIDTRIVEQMPAIVRESVRPLENIDGIKIVHMGGGALGSTAADGVDNGAGTPANVTDRLVQSALQYRAQAPLVDGLLREIGLEGGSLAGLTGTALSVGAAATREAKNGAPDAGGANDGAPAES